MKRAWHFTKRNFLEMIRDPLIYIFCMGFPVAMLLLFTLVNHYTPAAALQFSAPVLIPGILMFSFTFLTLLMSLLVSRDRSSAFLVRLYTTPMTAADFLCGYLVPGFVIGLVQELVCLVSGAIIAGLTGGTYFPFGTALLLALTMWPTMLFCIFLGILLGCVLNDKGAPGVTSALISAAGILGGAWMPLDTMGNFEAVCRFLPFYPPVYLGRILTGATHTLGEAYIFDSTAAIGIGVIAVWLSAVAGAAFWAFRRLIKK